MTNLVVIDPIDATHEGPNVPLPGGGDEYQLLHLRQTGPFGGFWCSIRRRPPPRSAPGTPS